MSGKTLLKRIVIFFLSLVAVIALLGWIFVNSRIADDDGELTAPTLLAKVEIVKDKWGTPHIKAQNEHDAMFAYGFTVAKDRLFQMDLQRRLARGELSELLGKDLVEIDKMYRTFMLRHWGEEYLKKSSAIKPEIMKYVDAFLEGVNYFVETGPHPFEYTLLGAEPRTFDRLDVASMTAYMAYSLMDGIKRDVMYTMIKKKINSSDLAVLFPDYSENNRVTIMEEKVDSIQAKIYADNSNEDKIAMSDIYNQLQPLFSVADNSSNWVPFFDGSNSWLIAPSRSKDGNALLANDPHIGISKPDVWYEAHVQYPGYNNFGYYVPMIPFPQIGHDDFKAWGITMFENDEVDLYAETFNNDDANKVMHKGEWTDVEYFNENISVKDSKDVTFDIRRTAHGPVISDFIDEYEGKPLAFSWVFFQIENPIFDVMYNISHAKSMEEFRSAASKLASPGLNFSYMDKEGNIAWWAAGRLPVRDPAVNAKEVLDGSSGEDEILSYVPFDENPQLVNPESGIIITSNNLSSKNPIGKIERLDGYFRASDRAERILELLNKKAKWTTEELMAIQTDNKLWSGLEMNADILEVLENSTTEWSDLEKTSLTALKNWDGFMETDSRGGSIFQFTIYHIMNEMLEPVVGKEQVISYINLIDHWDFLKNFLYKDIVPFKNAEDTDIAIYRKTVIRNGFRNAVTELKEKYGNDINKWQWGNIHTIEFKHPLGMVKPLNLIFNIGPFPSPAEYTAVNKFMSNLGDHDYKVTSIPSTRRLINIGDPDQSYTILPTGNSGNFQSKHYNDQVGLFMKGEYRKVNFTEEQIRKEKKHKFILNSK